MPASAYDVVFTVSESRFVGPDTLYEAVHTNIRAQKDLEIILEIDHARLAEEAGSPMPPSHVLIWSDPKLDAEIIKHNPLAAVDLPLRILACEEQESGKAAVIANSYAFLAERYGLPDDESLQSRYDAHIEKAMASAPTLGLDAFCQKLVVWQDKEGGVHVTLNDLLDLADRQQVSCGLPLRVINFRLKKTFSKAIEP